MSLDGRRVWLATRGGERARFYQPELIEALRAAGASFVEVVSVEGIFRSAAIDLGARAGEWLESAAARILRGLRIDRMLGREVPAGAAGDAAGAEAVTEDASAGPDLVLLDDPRLAQALFLATELRDSDPLVVGLIGDFRIDTRWRGSKIDALVVPHEELGHVFHSVNARVVVAGPPVATALAADSSPAESKAQLGLGAESSMVLVATEHMDADTLDRVVFQLTLLDHKPTVAFHYGQSEERAQLLRSAATDYGLQAQIFGDVANPALYYSAADAIVAPSDDPELIDLLTTWRPVVIVGPDRGAARASFLADHGAALRVDDVVELGTQIDSLLASGAGESFVTHAKALVSRQGTEQVVEALANLWAERETIKPAPEPEPEPEPSEGGPLVKPSAPPPFETIGVTREAAKSRPADLTPITAAEAKNQMAALIIREREAERALKEAVANRDRWLGRLELAKEYQDESLIDVASERLRLASAQVARMNGQIETIRRSKQKLKARVGRPKAPPAPGKAGVSARNERDIDQSSQIEARFRSMEIERDLDRLRRKLDDDDF